MAELAWRNVVGQSTNAGTSALQGAGNLFNTALDKLSTTAQSKQDTLIKQNTASALDTLQAVRTQEDLKSVSTSLRKDSLNNPNIDALALTRAMESKRKSITQEAQNTEDRTRRLRLDAKAEKKSDFDFQQAKDRAALADQALEDDKTAYGILSGILTNAQIGQKNTEAFTKAKETFYNADADSREGNQIKIGKGGSVEFTSEFGKAKQDTFNRLAYENGARPFTSYNEKRNELINSLRSSDLGHLESKFSTLFEQQENASKLSPTDQATLASKISGFSSKQARQIAQVEEKFAIKSDSIKPGTTLTSKENDAANIELYTLLDKDFDDEVIGPFYTGFQDANRLGGADLKDLVSGLLNQGVPTDDPTVSIVVSPDIIVKHLTRLKRTAGIIDGSGDNYVDKTTFINAITSDVLSSETKKKTATLKLELASARNSEISAIEKETADALASYTTNFYASKRIINPNRNLSKLRN